MLALARAVSSFSLVLDPECEAQLSLCCCPAITSPFLKSENVTRDQSASISDAARARALARSLALSFLVGGLSAAMYFFTVFLAIPRSWKWPGGTGPAPRRTALHPSGPAGSPWASDATGGGEAVSPYRPCVWTIRSMDFGRLVGRLDERS